MEKNKQMADIEANSLNDYIEWRDSVFFTSIEDFKARVNNPADGLTLPKGLIFSCVLTKPEDILEVANKMQDVSPLEKAGLLKEVFIKDFMEKEELDYLFDPENSFVMDLDAEVYVSAEEFNFKKEEIIVVDDINSFFPEDSQVHIAAKVEERGDYRNIPQAIPPSVAKMTFPCMLLVSDHSEFDRAGGMEIRHTMLLELPKSVTVINQEKIEYLTHV